MKKWLTTGEVARRLGRSRMDVTRMLSHERFTYFPGAYRTPGGHWRVPADDVELFLEQRKQAAQKVRRGR